MAEGAENAGLVRTLYSPIAVDYQEVWAPLLRPYGVRLLDALKLAGARRILDLGCGVGELLGEIEARAPGAVTMGADLTEAMLRRAPARFPRVAMDCTRPALAVGSFDVVVSAFMLFHVPEPSAALRCVFDLVRPGGGVGFAVWGKGEDLPGVEVWTEELDAYGAEPDPTAAGPADGEEKVNSPAKLGGLLAEVGFLAVETEAIPWEQSWDIDAFMGWRTRMGASRRRLQTLSPATREACIARVRERVQALPAGALIDRDEVILATAHRPPG
jgi:SAM-dependent methyltransferase